MSYKHIGNDQWHSMWLRQAEFGDVSELPQLAPTEVQQRLHGTTGVAAMRGALAFRKTIIHNIDALPEKARLIDFGCGWGRHLRVFLKDFTPKQMIGVDIDPDNIKICKSHLSDIRFYQCFENKALKIKSDHADLTVSFSVFSHINEISARFWINELARITKPTGTIVITSWGRSLFDIFDRINQTGRFDYAWERNIDRSFADKLKVRSMYDNGEYVFGRHGSPGASLDPDVYGISLMPRKWILNNSSLEVLKVIDDPKIAPQTTFFLRKRP